MTTHQQHGSRTDRTRTDRKTQPGSRAGAGDAGMTTAEYAVGTMAAVAFAVVLLGVVRSDAVTSALTGIITTALSAAS
ncbi:MAG: DUF4244 domain-containing protein [Dermatophilaceae bacterium]